MNKDCSTITVKKAISYFFTSLLGTAFVFGIFVLPIHLIALYCWSAFGYDEDTAIVLSFLTDLAIFFIFNGVSSTYSGIEAYVKEERKTISSLESALRKKKVIINSLKSELQRLRDSLEYILQSNLTSFPFLAGMIADYCTYDFEILAKQLDWGHDKKRLKKVQDIRKIRAEAKLRIEEAKVATYQLEYLKEIYPALDDVLDVDYKDVAFDKGIPDYDYTRDYLSKEEWELLSTTEKNQLALDRYIDSRKKSKWQIGRDYELFCGYTFEHMGYTVEYFGSNKGLEDLGRDLIVSNDKEIFIVQCKYWSKDKLIHEKHIFQLYGTLICYKIENPKEKRNINAKFITNIFLSDMAKNVAERLNIEVITGLPMGEFPRIKCNIGIDANGKKQRYTIFLWISNMIKCRFVKKVK